MKTLNDIKTAHLRGFTVCWGNTSYQVKGRDIDNLIVCHIPNSHCTGLTDDYKPEDFFILTHSMTPAEQAEHDAGVASGLITPGTPVVPFSCAARLTAIHGIPNGRLTSKIAVWTDAVAGGSVAVSFNTL